MADKVELYKCSKCGYLLEDKEKLEHSESGHKEVVNTKFQYRYCGDYYPNIVTLYFDDKASVSYMSRITFTKREIELMKQDFISWRCQRPQAGAEEIFEQFYLVLKRSDLVYEG